MYRITIVSFAVAGFCAICMLIISYILHLSVLYLFLIKLGILSSSAVLIATISSLKLLGKDRTDTIIKNIVVLVISLVLVLVLSEIVVRYIFKDISTTGDSNRSYFSRKWYKSHVRLNSLGFREVEYILDKPEGLFRIMFMGDSFTFGQGIEEGCRFSNLIWQHLKNKGSYQVLNFGKPGFETVDHLAVLKKTIILAKPDFIVLQWFINDFEGKNKKGRPQKIPLLPSAYLRSKLQRFSALYYLVNSRWNSLQSALGLSKSYAEYMVRRFKDPSSEDSIRAVSEMQEFIHLCKARKIGVGIILFPDCFALQKNYPFTYLHKRVLDLCDSEKLTCIDLIPTFENPPDKVQLWVNQFDHHPSAYANKLAADRIWETFSQIWLSN